VQAAFTSTAYLIRVLIRILLFTAFFHDWLLDWSGLGRGSLDSLGYRLGSLHNPQN